MSLSTAGTKIIAFKGKRYYKSINCFRIKTLRLLTKIMYKVWRWQKWVCSHRSQNK